jgi:SAM-dependent methyltransferase
MTNSLPGFFEGTEMPTAGWWEVLWPDPAGVLIAVGVKRGMEVIDLCSGDGWFTLQIARIARHVVAIDIDLVLLEVARTRLKKAASAIASFARAMPISLPVLRPGLLTSSSWRTRSMACQIVFARPRLSAKR